MSFPIMEKVSADPAANNEIVYTADENMIVKSVAFTLVSDATAANRTVTLIADDGTDIFFRTTGGSPQAASETWTYGAYQGCSRESVGVFHLNLGFPEGGLYLPAGSRLRTNTINRQAGDNYSAMILQVERI